MTPRARRLLGVVGVALLLAVVGVGLWVRLADTPTARYLVRFSVDHEFQRAELLAWGVRAPLVFIAIQALQVIISPIPGEVTGFIGGYLFGQWTGLAYSMIGLTLGSLFAFAIGRWLGVAFVRRLVSPEVWHRLGFIVEAEGSILCFVLYLIPGFPKDILCYLFGLSPMPFWVFALTSTVGRLPGTWVLSAQGAQIATGRYVEIALVTGLVAAVGLPLYYYRDRVVRWLRRAARR
jgi:uncharacterized membrane protein YdjX (TVP38/TMEM64 family)